MRAFFVLFLLWMCSTCAWATEPALLTHEQLAELQMPVMQFELPVIAATPQPKAAARKYVRKRTHSRTRRAHHTRHHRVVKPRKAHVTAAKRFAKLQPVVVATVLPVALAPALTELTPLVLAVAEPEQPAAVTPDSSMQDYIAARQARRASKYVEEVQMAAPSVLPAPTPAFPARAPPARAKPDKWRKLSPMLIAVASAVARSIAGKGNIAIPLQADRSGSFELALARTPADVSVSFTWQIALR